MFRQLVFQKSLSDICITYDKGLNCIIAKVTRFSIIQSAHEVFEINVI